MKVKPVEDLKMHVARAARGETIDEAELYRFMNAGTAVAQNPRWSAMFGAWLACRPRDAALRKLLSDSPRAAMLGVRAIQSMMAHYQAQLAAIEAQRSPT